MNSVLLFGTSPRPACAGAAPRIQPSSNHYREAMDGMAGGSDSDSEEGEEDGISRTPAPSSERRMRRGSAPIPTILQHRHGEPAGLLMQMFITYAPEQRADSNHPAAQTGNTPVPDE